LNALKSLSLLAKPSPISYFLRMKNASDMPIMN
jgi:hypothetical protein